METGKGGLGERRKTNPGEDDSGSKRIDITEAQETYIRQMMFKAQRLVALDRKVLGALQEMMTFEIRAGPENEIIKLSSEKKHSRPVLQLAYASLNDPSGKTLMKALIFLAQQSAGYPEAESKFYADMCVEDFNSPMDSFTDRLLTVSYTHLRAHET